MSSIAAYVEELTDADLYNELQKHGYPAGPVVETTRSVYKNKLLKILEGANDDSKMDYKPDEKLSSSFLSEERKMSRKTFTSPSPSKNYSPAYSQEDSPEPYPTSSSAKLYSSTSKSYSSVPSARSYLYTSKLDSEIDALKERLDSQRPLISQVTSDYGTGPASYERRSYSDVTSLRRRPGEYSNYPSSALSRRSYQGRRNEKSLPTLQIVIFASITIVILVLLYLVYSAWQETDPYRQVEHEAMEIAEKIKNQQSEKNGDFETV